MRIWRFGFLILICGINFCFAQIPEINKVEPANWWTGMKLNKIQLMVYGKNLKGAKAVSGSREIKIIKTHQIENSSYSFVDIEISPKAKPGLNKIKIKTNGGEASFDFPLLKRRNSADEHKGFNSSDVIYLIIPDRFANGDTTNDNYPGMFEGADRTSPGVRHGGDLQGIISKLDYLHDLGVTTLWLTPVVENNMYKYSYHGYSVTNLYKTDPRIGTNELYRKFVVEAHRKGLKVIMDHVNNHIGTHHPWMENLPMPDWFNGTALKHQEPFHSKVELDDIHTDSVIKQKAVTCWFDTTLADLNQLNPFVAKYLIQSTIWWVEFSGVDGIREDTYPYNFAEYRETWAKTVMDEYPKFNIVGEVWAEDPVLIAPYQKGGYFPRKYAPQLPCVTDFGMYDAFRKTFIDTAGRTESIFNCIAKDFLYPNPNNLMLFLDNHDIRRIAYTLNGDEKRLRLALLTLLTTRGIPQILYATEIGMKGGTDDGTLRSDFPGGFAGDKRDAFTAAGRTEQENRIYNFTSQFLKIRKEHKALQFGDLIHFRPVNDAYVYFRTYKNEKLMVVINHNKQKQEVNTSAFAYRLNKAKKLKSLITGNEIDLLSGMKIEINGMDGDIFEIID